MDFLGIKIAQPHDIAHLIYAHPIATNLCALRIWLRTRVSHHLNKDTEIAVTSPWRLSPNNVRSNIITIMRAAEDTLSVWNALQAIFNDKSKFPLTYKKHSIIPAILRNGITNEVIETAYKA